MRILRSRWEPQIHLTGGTLVRKSRHRGAIRVRADSFHHARGVVGLATCGPAGLLLFLHRFTSTLRNFTDTNRAIGLI
jgi:hypothetical protein